MAIPLRVTKADVERAMERIAQHIRRTPTLAVKLLECRQLECRQPTDSRSVLDPNSVILKLEYLQYSGSFKGRGAFHNLLTQEIPEAREIPEVGVVAASGGNHGAAVAFVAQQLGVPAHIFVPEVSAIAKRERIEQFGAKLKISGQRYADSLAAATAFALETGALTVHAYDTPETLAGAGTVALEIVQQHPDIDTVLVAVGGGGLLGGMSAYLGDDVKIVAVETQGTAALYNALQAGHPVDVETDGIATDSLGAKRIGDLCFPLLQQFVDKSLLVSDDEVRQAQKLLWQNFRIVSEPGGAVAFAAISSGRYRPLQDEKVAIVLCGANTDVVVL